ncbi:MAG: hypothetical protein LBC37_05160 [Zoogloeaceae bacterium]|jgi:hypothetical protein|nr:hypothetical protein [Zoogloeaceae bacterium]
MYNNTGSVEGNITIRYVTTGCSQYDLVLLRSVLALYGTQGNATWDYHRTQDVDLVIIGSEIAPAQIETLLHTKIRLGQAVLIANNAVIASSRHQLFLCPSPPHARQLVERLKEIEDFIRQQRIHLAIPSRFERNEYLESNPIKLVQWPSPELLADDRDFWRFATMLSASPITLDDAATRFACPREKIREFLYELHRTGFAQPLAQEDMPPALPAKPENTKRSGLKGLFQRIRMSLGLQTDMTS